MTLRGSGAGRCRAGSTSTAAAFPTPDFGCSATNHQFDIDGVGGTVGAEYGFGNGIVGVAANYTRPRVSFGNDAAEVDSKSWQVGAYGGFGMGGFFGQGYLGYGSDRHDIERVGVIDELRADPDGSHVVAGAKAGYLLPVWKVRAGPIVALDYARAKVDGYTESGDAALTLDVGKQTLKGTTGQVGIEGRLQLIEGVSSYLTVAAERDLSGGSRVLHFAQTSAPTIVNEWDVSREKETYGRTTSGSSFNLWDGATLNTTISRTFGREGGQEFGAQIGFKTGF
jgi:outer membrane lipase/esterase